MGRILVTALFRVLAEFDPDDLVEEKTEETETEE